MRIGQPCQQQCSSVTQRLDRAQTAISLPYVKRLSATRQSTTVMAAKRQRARLPVRTALPLIPRIRRPQRFAFVTNPADLDPDEVDALWTLSFAAQPQEPRRWRTRDRWEMVLRHSYAVRALIRTSHALGQYVVQAVFEVTPAPRADGEAQQSSRRLVGFARAISDGVFAALVCDIMVHPDLQRQGLGKKMMAALLKHVRRRGPSSFGVFPRPKQRMFFWETGFRVTSKYRVMRYQLPAHGAGGPTSELLGGMPPSRVPTVEQLT